MTEEKKEYTNDEVTVVWQKHKCTHSANCVTGLPEVFRPKEKPWVDVDAATTEENIEQVKQCPSGALTYYLNSKK